MSSEVAPDQAVRTFRVFVSSTFEDLAAERDALARSVYPRLQRLCASRGARFQAIDLRWGISAEAALDQQTVSLCLAEIRRCQELSPRPNFVVLVGDKYGWRPLPTTIAATVFDDWISRIVDTADRALLGEWYRRDDNAMPAAYVLQPRRDPVEPGMTREEADAAVDREWAEWGWVEARLRVTLQASGADLDTSITEQEIMAGALDPELTDAADHVFVFKRSIEGLPADTSTAGFIDLDAAGRPDRAAAARLATLESRLRKRLPDRFADYSVGWTGTGPSTDHLVDLCADVYRALAGVIAAELDSVAGVAPLDTEIVSHRRWGAERRRHFVGRDDVLTAIEKYLAADDPVPLFLRGNGGSGKTALLAEAVHRHQPPRKRTAVVTRYVGATPASARGAGLLQSLCRQIGLAYRVDEAIPNDVQRLGEVFADRLALATERRPLVVVVDAVDQIRDALDPADPAWVPRRLPPHVRMVVSTTAAPARAARVVELGDLPSQHAAELLDRWLSGACRTLTDAQRAYLLDCFERCRQPLYLKLVFEEARRWHSYDQEASIAHDIDGMLDQLIGRLSGEANHGAALVDRVLAYLAASRDGLTEDELLDVLSADDAVMSDFRRRSPKSPARDELPTVVWSRLRGDLDPYLAEFGAAGAVVIGFYHRLLAEHASAVLVGADHQRVHSALADYFAAQPGSVKDSGVSTPNRRRLTELPFQLARAGRRTELIDLLTDSAHLTSKLDALGPSAVVDDFAEARHCGIDDQALRTLEHLFTLTAHLLADDPSQLRSQAFGRLAGSPHPELRRLLEQLEQSDREWLRPVVADLALPGGPLQWTLVGHRNEVRRVAFLDEGRRLITSSADGSDRIWDVETGSPVAMFTDLHETKEIWDCLPSEEEIGGDPTGRRTARVEGCVIEVGGGDQPLVLRGHHQPVQTIDFSPDGSRLASAGSGHTVRIWKLDDVVRPATYAGDARRELAIAADVVVTAGIDGAVRIHDLADGAERFVLAHDAPVSALCVMADGTRTITGTADGLVRSWDLTTGESHHTFSGHEAAVRAVAIAPDGERALSASTDGSLRTWDLVNGRAAGAVEGPTSTEPLISISRSGRWGAAAYRDKSARIWELGTSRLTASCFGHRGHITGVAFAPDGSLVTAAEDNTVRVWDSGDGFERATLLGHWRKVCSLAVADTSRAVSVGGDFTLRVWDLRSRIETHTLGGVRIDPFGRPSQAPAEERTGFHPSGASQVVVTPDGSRAVSFYINDDTLRLWDLDAGVEVAAFTGDEVLRRCALAEDGRSVAAITRSGRLLLLRLEEPVAMAPPVVKGKESS